MICTYGVFAIRDSTGGAPFVPEASLLRGSMPHPKNYLREKTSKDATRRAIYIYPLACCKAVSTVEHLFTVFQR